MYIAICVLTYIDIVNADFIFFAKDKSFIKESNFFKFWCSSDFGTTLYESFYPNSGVHYALANQILAEDFIDDIPLYCSLIIALLVSLLFFILSHKIKSSIKIIIIGVCFIILIFTGGYAYFYYTHQYPMIMIPAASLILTFISVIIIKYISESHSKRLYI